MYVCATGSIPVAAALISKGFPPGAAVTFLIAGPATNTVTITFVKSRFGSKTLTLYLTTIIVVAVGFGFATDTLLGPIDSSLAETFKSSQHIPIWKTASAVILSLLMMNPKP